MKRICNWAPILAVVCLLGSCGGGGDLNGEQIISDQLQHWEQISTVLDGVSSGGDPAEAAQRLTTLSEGGQAIMERKRQLFAKLDPTEAEALEELFAERQSAALKRLTEAIQKLEQSGRATDEIAEAIMGMNTQ